MTAPPGPRVPDLLVSGDDRPRRQLAAADAQVLRLALLRAGQDDALVERVRRPGLHVAVANAGPATVRLLWGTLDPAGWQVQVPAERELRPGRSVVLTLTPPVACGAAEPRLLRLDAVRPSGHPATAELDLTDAALPDGGRFADAAAAAARDCDPSAAPVAERRTYPHRS